VKLDYYKEYCIDTLESLHSRLDSDGNLQQDVRLLGDFISLGSVKSIYGHLNLDNDLLSDLGELIYVKSDIWINSEKSRLNSLGKLEQVGGDLLINNSNINDLGNLKRVSGKANFRDSDILDLGRLEYIGGDLFLPKRFEGIDLSNIKVKGKVRFWNDKNESKTVKLLSEYEWETIHFSRIHHSEIINKNRVLTGEILVKNCFKPSELNDYILSNVNDFFDFVDKELMLMYNEKYSFFDVLYGEIKSVKMINDEFPIIKFDKRKSDFLKKRRTQSNYIIRTNKAKYPFDSFFKKLNELKKICDFHGNTSKYWLCYDEYKLSRCQSTGTELNAFIYFVEDIILQTFSIYVYNLQNEFRLSRGVPRIGEGWVSETDLYYKLKKHFSNLEVMHHGKTKWLGLQHIDIWFPEYNIGVEYQGVQHQKPIDFFGGEEGFVKNQERDKRKKELFKKNNSYLIEVFPNYSLEVVVQDIQSIISNISQKD
tara:strand:- start:86 stop:1528 length:1443 start_codon:yes stop_codon:yes gene_type:complete